jgi:hypothetical protein
LQGYFGEVFAGLVAEHYSPFNVDGWVVPAFLFRFHAVAFQQLEAAIPQGRPPTDIPGRTGDDCLAFLRNRAGEIVSVLYCEAKCTTSHRTDLIADAHEKVSSAAIVDVLQVIEVLRDNDSALAAEWVDRLRRFRIAMQDGRVDRRDLVCYVCGQHPVRQQSWMSSTEPHASYTADRHLEVAEVHVTDVASKVQAVYAREAWS